MAGGGRGFRGRGRAKGRGGGVFTDKAAGEGETRRPRRSGDRGREVPVARTRHLASVPWIRSGLGERRRLTENEWRFFCSRSGRRKPRSTSLRRPEEIQNNSHPFSVISVLRVPCSSTAKSRREGRGPPRPRCGPIRPRRGRGGARTGERVTEGQGAEGSPWPCLVWLGSWLVAVVWALSCVAFRGRGGMARAETENTSPNLRGRDPCCRYTLYEGTSETRSCGPRCPFHRFSDHRAESGRTAAPLGQRRTCRGSLTMRMDRTTWS